jgi:hypothetical protein
MAFTPWLAAAFLAANAGVDAALELYKYTLSSQVALLNAPIAVPVDGKAAARAANGAVA